MTARSFTFAAGESGSWRIVKMRTIVGPPLAEAPRLNVTDGVVASAGGRVAWALQGVTSNERYVTRSERSRLVAKQEAPGRSDATRAALIPIRKNATWWDLPQDQRRRIFETQSRHIGIGLEYLPAVARRLHHCRDLASHEPFDFLTWFEFAPSDEGLFNDLVERLRATEEWKYVDREVDIRLSRDRN